MKTSSNAAALLEGVRRAGYIDRLGGTIRKARASSTLPELNDHLLRDIGLRREDLLFSSLTDHPPLLGSVRRT